VLYGQVRKNDLLRASKHLGQIHCSRIQHHGIIGRSKRRFSAAAIPSIALVGLVFAITGLIYTYWIKHVDYLAYYYWTLFITPMFMFAGVFFRNFLPLGTAGELLSAGTMPLSNIAVGLEVCGAFVLIWTEFLDQALLIGGE